MTKPVITGRAGKQVLRSKEFVLEPGALLRNGTDIVQVECLDGPDCVLRHRATYELKVLPIQTMLAMYAAGDLLSNFPEEGKEVPPIDPHDSGYSLIHDLSPAAFAHGRTVLAYIKALRALGYDKLRPTPILQMDFIRVKEKFREENSDYIDLALSTVYKWSIAFDRNGEDPRSVFPDFSSRGGRGGHRIAAPALQALVDQVERLKTKKKEVISFSGLHSMVEERLMNDLGEAPMFDVLPSRSTIERYIKSEFSPYDLTRRNKGERFAQRIYADHYPRDKARYALEVIEFDDKDSRTYLINGMTGLPCGRGFITTGVDQATQIPVGLSAGDKPRSLVSAMNAFRDCLLPKDLSRLAIDAEFFGPPSIALFDNALYNHAIALERAVFETSHATVAFAKPYTPKEKSKVEDFNGWFGKWIATQPGYGGDKRTKDELGNGKKTAKMTTQEFVDKTLIWAYGQYANTARSNGMTPRQHWHTLTRNLKLRLPRNLQQLDAAFAIGHELKLRDDGILFTGIPYQNDDLKRLRRLVGHNSKIQFRYHPNNVNQIHVYDPFNRSYFLVKSAIPLYTTDLTLFQHKLIRKIARENQCRNPAFGEMMKYRQMLCMLTTQKFASTKFHDRQWANRVGRITPENKSAVPASAIVNELLNDLGEAIEQLDRVTLELQDDEWDLPEDF